MLKQAQGDHDRFQHQLTGKMSCGRKRETFGGGISDQNTLNWKRCNIHKWFWGMLATLCFLALGHHTPIARESSQDQCDGPGWGLGATEAAGAQLPEPSEQDTEITELHRPSAHKPGKLNQTGKRLAAVALLQQDKEEQFISQGKCPTVRLDASKGARGEEAIRWRARKGSKAQEYSWKN